MRAEQSRAEQSRAEQSRAEQSRAEQSRAEQSRAEQYLSKDFAQCIKGIFAVAVLIHHLYQRTLIVGGVMAGGLQALGYLAVGMFFFFTGYGLMYSSRKAGYIDSFLARRLIPLYMFNTVLICFYTAYKAILHFDYSLKDVGQSFFFGNTVVTLGWYLQVTLLIYCLFWGVFTLCKSDRIRCILMLLSIVGYCIVCVSIGLGETWYQGTPCVYVGMLWCYGKKRIDIILGRLSSQIAVVSCLSFIMFFLTRSFAGVISTMLASIAFVIFVIAAVYTICSIPKGEILINNKFTRWLGKYSFEIYVTQGFFLGLRRGGRIQIDDPYLFIAVCVVGTMIVAIAMSSVRKKVYKMGSRLMSVR